MVGTVNLHFLSVFELEENESPLVKHERMRFQYCKLTPTHIRGAVQERTCGNENLVVSLRI